MSFFSKLAKKLSGKDSKSHAEHREETKTPHHGTKEKKTTEKQVTISKVNLNAIYNKCEDYKPVNISKNTGNGCSKLTNEKLLQKYKEILQDEAIVDIENLRKLAWQGIPYEYRPTVWKILLKYMPVNKEKRESTMTRKREEYAHFSQMYYYSLQQNELDETEKKTLKLIKDDVHRTQPEYPLFHESSIQQMMIRLLWVWHVRHPASGYVQGINDLTTPFIAAFLKEYVNIDFDTYVIPTDFKSAVTEEVIKNLEADVYWCLCKILDGVLDNYTLSQMGTQKSLVKIKEITKKIDAGLNNHLEKSEVDFTFFSLRWIFCLLVREFPLRVGMRLFDTYISDEQGFSVLHVYVCAALLLKWSKKLKKMSFAELMVFLQSMPTKDWGEQDIEMIVAEAYVFMTLYEESPGHFSSSTQTTNNSGLSASSSPYM
jgi:hypothetical protein